MAKQSAARDARARAGKDETEARELRPVRGRGTDASPAELDRVIHERLRLGNLSVHARKLEDAGYVACTKSFEGRVPRTEYRLTTAGRRAFERYVDHMEALIHTVRDR